MREIQPLPLSSEFRVSADHPEDGRSSAGAHRNQEVIPQRPDEDSERLRVVNLPEEHCLTFLQRSIRPAATHPDSVSPFPVEFLCDLVREPDARPN